MACRPFLLRWGLGCDVRVVHLSRSLGAVQSSILSKGSNWAAEGKSEARTPSRLRATVGWCSGNVIAVLFGALASRSRYVRVRYEDLVESPERVIEAIGRVLPVPVAPILEIVAEDRAMSPGHRVGGNRLRYREEIKLRRGK
jgi:hypothetical protein